MGLVFAQAPFMSGSMGRERPSVAARAIFAALLITAGYADESQDNALKPVDLKKDGFDVTLQALPSGETQLSMGMPNLILISLSCRRSAKGQGLGSKPHHAPQCHTFW